MNRGVVKVVPVRFLKALANALKSNRLGLVLVVSKAAMSDLAHGRAALLALEDGGAIVLVPEEAVERVYGEEVQP